jgi:hypothetical protein
MDKYSNVLKGNLFIKQISIELFLCATYYCKNCGEMAVNKIDINPLESLYLK